MNKFLFQLIALLLIVFGSTFVYATETDGSLTEDIPLTGDELVYCNVMINVTDKTSVPIKEDINITLTDISVGKAYYCTITFDEHYGIGKPQVLKVLANTTYKVNISFNHSDKYSIVNFDGSEIETFHATESGYLFNWNIVSGGTVLKEKSDGISNIEINTDNKEADSVLFDFIHATKHIQQDEAWRDFLDIYELYSEIRVDRYVKYCGGTEEEWLAMTPYEQFLWYELYIRQCMYIDEGEYSFFFGSEEDFIKYNISSIYLTINSYGKAEAEAYKTIMLWQYNYIKLNGKPFNLMSGFKYTEIESNDSIDAFETEMKDMNESDEVRETQIEEKTSHEDDAEEKGIWSDVITKLKENIISFILLFILACGLITITIIKNHFNIDDSEE